jgi:hypothetical protein
MKKILMTLIISCLLVNMVYAQAKKSQAKILKGKIGSVSLADQTAGTKSEIVVQIARNKKSIFLVMSTTRIYDKDAKATSLEQLQKNQFVQVKYLTTKEGVNEAQTIKVENGSNYRN